MIKLYPANVEKMVSS